MDKPFSQACENNKQPILTILTAAFCGATHVLEIGSGTGQHAIWFARNLPYLYWQPTDRCANLLGLRHCLKDVPLENIAAPLALDVEPLPWPVPKFDSTLRQRPESECFYVFGAVGISLSGISWHFER